MARPIKSTKVQRFFKYTGFFGGILAIMALHFYVQPPEKYTKRAYREAVQVNKMIWTDRGINPHMWGEVARDGPFSPPMEK